MLSKLRKFISWVFLKLVFGVFVVSSLVTAYALWLFRHDDPNFPAVHAQRIEELMVLQTATKTARDTAAQELAGIQQEHSSHREHAVRAAAIASNLRELQSWSAWIFGNREQQRLNSTRLDHLKEIEKESLSAANKLSRNLTRAAVRLAAAERELQEVNAELEFAEKNDSQVLYYLHASWQSGRWIFLGLLGLYFFGPTLQKLILFYYWAPRIARGRPVQLARATAPFPQLGKSSTAVEASLWPGETARVRKRYLLAMDDGLARTSRWLLSRRFPLTSLLSGFVRDVDLHNARAGHDYRLVFAHHKNPENQMAIVHVPEGGSLVVRPSFLAGVILPPGQKLRLRRRWQLFRWQAWVTGQLRFLEFSGPCRLVVAGRPGLRAESLIAPDEGVRPTCRTSLDKVIAFTPGLEYRLIRTTRFWNYYRWDALLFDACFVGVGFVLIQTRNPGRSPGIWSSTRNRARKVLGL